MRRVRGCDVFSLVIFRAVGAGRVQGGGEELGPGL